MILPPIEMNEMSCFVGKYVHMVVYSLLQQLS